MGEATSDWSSYLEYAALTDIGMRRPQNQDNHVAVPASSVSAWRARGHLFVVADGMGAHAAGELASKMAVDGIPLRYQKYEELSPPEALQRAMVDTNAEIHRRGHANNEFHNMGTTTSVLALLPQGAVVAHVGDSRVYRLRGDKFEQLTADHSLVWELRSSGKFPPDADLNRIAPRNVITRSLGPHANVQVDLEGPLRVQPGDTFLLCSDGLTGRVNDVELAAILAYLAPTDAAQLLVDLANLRGGPDNITVIVIRVVGSPDGDSTSVDEPITIGARRPGQTAQLIVYMAAVVSLLMCLVFMMTMNGGLAAVAALVSLSILGGGYFYVRRLRAAGVTLTEGRRLGKGPYVSLNTPGKKEFLDCFPSLIQQLRTIAEEFRWCDNFPDLSSQCERAAHLAAEGRQDEALTAYARTIQRMMQRVRNERQKPHSDSTVDY